MCGWLGMLSWFFFFFLANVCMFTVDFERGVELCVGLFIQAHSMVLTIYW